MDRERDGELWRINVPLIPPSDGQPLIRPRSVRVLRANGNEYPIALRYDGYRDGRHVWTATERVILLPIDRIVADWIPPHHTVDIPFKRPYPEWN